MDANLITVLAGVLGSVSGASAAIATTWIAQKNQTVRERAKWDTRKRETRRAPDFQLSRRTAKGKCRGTDRRVRRKDSAVSLPEAVPSGAKAPDMSRPRAERALRLRMVPHSPMRRAVFELFHLHLPDEQ